MFVLRIHARLCYLSTHQFISVRPAINVLHYRPKLCSENVALKRPHVFPVFIVKHIYCHSHFKPLFTVVLVFYVCVFLFFTPLSLCLHFARHFFFFFFSYMCFCDQDPSIVHTTVMDIAKIKGHIYIYTCIYISLEISSETNVGIVCMGYPTSSQMDTINYPDKIKRFNRNEPPRCSSH